MRKLVTLMIIIGMLSAITGCGNTSDDVYDNADNTKQSEEEKGTTTVESSTEGEKPQEKELSKDKVTFVLDWLPNTNHTGIYTAIEKGYYDDVNMEVEVIQPSEGGAEALVAAGQADFGVSFQETITAARTADNPVPVVAIAAVIQNNTSGFASLAEKGINTPKDFEGKLYGSWGTEIETAFINTMMEKDGADISKLNVVDVVSWDFLTSITNDVDLQWIYYGWDGIAAEVKGVDISFIKLQDIDERLNFYTPVLMTSESLIDENPDLIRRFLEATSKGYVYAAENPDEAVEDLIKHAPETDAEIALASQRYLANEYIADAQQWGIMNEEIWTGFSAWMYENNVISKELDVDKAYTNGFLPEGSH